MDTKKASANSLSIILCSQAASFLTTAVKGTFPVFSWYYLLRMVPAGVLGGMIGAGVNRRISAGTADRLFYALLAVIIGICLYNAVQFAA